MVIPVPAEHRKVCFRLFLFLVVSELVLFILPVTRVSVEYPEPGSYEMDSITNRSDLFNEKRTVSSLTYNCSSMGVVENCLTKSIGVAMEPKKTICSAKGIDLLLIIITTHDHEWRRNILRENFRYQQNMTQHSMRLVFLLGRLPLQESMLGALQAKVLRKNIIQEAVHHGDILQGDFLDVYPNNTLKAIFAMQWYRQACPQARFLMKADDDMSLNLGPLLDRVTSNHSLDRFMMGRCDLTRNIDDYRYIFKFKNRLPETIYPDDYIPPYCAGGAYLLSAEVVPDILIAVRWVPLLYVEDIYIGIVVARLKRPLTILNMPEQFKMSYDVFDYPSLCRRLEEGTIFAIHNKHAEGLEYFARECYPSKTKLSQNSVSKHWR